MKKQIKIEQKKKNKNEKKKKENSSEQLSGSEEARGEKRGRGGKERREQREERGGMRVFLFCFWGGSVRLGGRENKKFKIIFLYGFLV